MSISIKELRATLIAKGGATSTTEHLRGLTILINDLSNATLESNDVFNIINEIASIELSSIGATIIAAITSKIEEAQAEFDTL